MTLNLTMRCMMSFGIGMALLMGIALAQEPPADKDKGQEKTSTVVKAPAEAVAPSKKEAEAPAPAVKSEPATPPLSDQRQVGEPTIQSHTDKISYAFGVNLARDVKRQGNNLNVSLFMRALTDALAGRKLIMTDEEVTATLKKFEEEQKHDLQHARMMISERNRREGEAFFAENAKKEGVVTLPSGLQYKVLKQSDGKKPKLDDNVVCNYRGTLVDGTEFDSSYRRNQPTTLPVKGVIAGWTQALQMMPVGSKWQLFIPPQLAYGEKIVSGIGPNAMLIFEVELISIEDKAQAVGAVR